MKRALKIGALSLLTLLAVIAMTLWLGLRASLPELDGRARLSGLQAPATLSRDAGGVPTISATSRVDLARALGYAHAQDRFFQMDLLRRAAAGELSELLGPGLLDTDKRLRRHRFRTTAVAALASLDGAHRALLSAYTQGVNAGLASLRGRPFEYWLLQSAPRPWREEDSFLCVHAMFLQLQDPTGHEQLQRGLLQAALPAALWQFVDAGAPEWEAAVDGTPRPEPVVPGVDQVNLRMPDLPDAPPPDLQRTLAKLGSNNWAVAGARTASGAAMLANDMHLGLRVPNIWYRVRLVQPAAAQPLDLTGVTLPGAPLVVAGSNGHLAWGFTNSYGTFEAVIRLVPDPADPHGFRTAAGSGRLHPVEEVIRVKGGAAQTLQVWESPWGPVLGEDWEHHPYVLAWTAHDPAAINLNLIALERARGVDDALQSAPLIGIPGQNLMLADAAGHIGWTVAGRLPLRGAEESLPQLSTDARVGFQGWLAPADQPRVLDPQEGLLWSANARVVGGEAARRIGDAGMDRGARAGQIHADLMQAPRPFTAAASLAVQLDDRAVFLTRWRDLLSALLERHVAQERRLETTRAVLAGWSGHAVPADAAYRLVHAFRAQVELRAYFGLVAPARRIAPDFEFQIPASFEGPLWRLMQSRPMHLLPLRYPSWDALLLEALDAAQRVPAGCGDLPACTWGRVNQVHITHPLSRALPALAGLLDMPVMQLPGGREDMPRVQGPDYGASERFSVSPGHEAEGYFHMPGGQSGHPLSPFYRGDFQAWAAGAPAPFLPGRALHSLTLSP